MNTDNRKTLILSALRAFINQRSGIEFGNYGDVKAFRAEQRGIQKDRREALELLRAVELSDGIDADALLKASRSAYSGRLTIKEVKGGYSDPKDRTYRDSMIEIDYACGQYFVTEYRRAACAVLASALWEYTREHCMPAVTGYRVESWMELGKGRTLGELHVTREEAEAECETLGGSSYGHVNEVYPQHGLRFPAVSAGDWLRAHFARQFGRGIASRWFS
jgi:hypothetical protein